MDCAEAREYFHDLNRGRLPADAAEAVRVHLRICAACAEALRADAELRTRLRAEVPKYAAPPALRARIQSLVAEAAIPKQAPTFRAGWRRWWTGHRWTLGSLAGAMAALLLVWAGWLWTMGDPATRLVDRAAAEHGEYVEQTMTAPLADPQVVIRQLQGKVGYPLGPIFPGDSQEHMVAGRVSELAGRRAVAFIYRDSAGRYTTLFLLPAAGIPLPREGRLRIETFTPYHRVVAGRQVYLWPEGTQVCVLVSDLDQEKSASIFLKIRRMM